MQPERRVLRSADPSQAIRIFLAKNAGEPGVLAAAIASDDGLLLGGVGNEDLDALAAVGAAMDAGRDVAKHCDRQGWSPRTLFAQRLRVGSDDFTLTTLGAPMFATDDVSALLSRILA